MPKTQTPVAPTIVMEHSAASPSPATVAMLKPFYVRNATIHADEPGRYATAEEALRARAALQRRNPDALLIVKDRRQA